MIHLPQFSGEKYLLDEKSSYWIIFAFAFVILFSFAVTASLVRIQWKNLLPVSDDSKGIVGSVNSAIYSFMPYIT